MDLEKLGHLMDEAKGGDVAFYLLLAFTSVSPGFLYLFVLKPDLIMSYDVTRLLLLCISISGSGLFIFTLTTWLCFANDESAISLRLFVMIGCMGSIGANLLALAFEGGEYFLSVYFYWVGNMSAIVSATSGVGKHWSRRYIFNFGTFIFIMTTIIIFVANKPWVALAEKAS